MKKPSILIIDDEPNNFDVMETFLSDQDYQLQYAASGQEAIDSLDSYDPDLILLDVMMPEMDGIEVCRQIKALSKWQTVPIIMVTALSSKSDLAHCLTAGADDFISKPVNAVELRARVHSMLRIKHQYDDLQTLLKLREDMVNMVIHDLRNPLSSILFSLEMLQNIEYSREKQQRKLEQIYLSAQVLQGLVDDLLQVALIESGKIRLNRTEIDLCHLIESVIANFESIAAQKNQTVISRFPEEFDRKVSVDATLMHRVLDNLLANAIKFSPHHSQIIVNIEQPMPGNPKIQIIDFGAGIPETMRQRIFEKYEIGTLMPHVSQIGLGLAFCKMVVEAHGGTVYVSSNQPQGTIFEITL